MDNDMLFALRTYYQDFYQDEKDIIEMLKTNLIEKNVPADEVNTILKNFYNEFGIDINLEVFEQINALPTHQELIQNFISNIINTNNTVENSDEEILNADDDDEDNDDDDENQETENSNNNIPIINYYQDISSDLIYYYQPTQYNLFGNNNTQTNNITNLLNLLNTVIPIVQNESNDVICTLDEEDKKKLKRYKLDDDIKTQCNICLDNMVKDQEVMELPCDHTYHYECINEYLEKYSYKCPCCRIEVGKPKYNF